MHLPKLKLMKACGGFVAPGMRHRAFNGMHYVVKYNVKIDLQKPSLLSLNARESCFPTDVELSLLN